MFRLQLQTSPHVQAYLSCLHSCLEWDSRRMICPPVNMPTVASTALLPCSGPASLQGCPARRRHPGCESATLSPCLKRGGARWVQGSRFGCWAASCVAERKE